jgi:hypothetical protein
LFQALTGRPPFLGPDLVAQHLGEPPPAPSTLRAGLAPAHDAVIARALAKSPDERFASASEMAAALAAWPTEGATAPIAVTPREDIAPADEPAVEDVGREVGRTPLARLILRRDPRTARDVLVEQRDLPLDAAAIADVRQRAAAGGPDVQRVLRLDEDRREIWYEPLEGSALPLADATDAERPVLEAARSALIDVAPTHFARTSAGPVWLVSPIVQPVLTFPSGGGNSSHGGPQ